MVKDGIAFSFVASFEKASSGRAEAEEKWRQLIGNVVLRKLFSFTFFFFPEPKRGCGDENMKRRMEEFLLQILTTFSFMIFSCIKKTEYVLSSILNSLKVLPLS